MPEATITINLSKTEIAIKRQLKSLKETANESNPYHGLSESVIAKKLLKPELERVFKQYCGKKGV